MNGKKEVKNLLIVDTDILIDAGRGDNNAVMVLSKEESKYNLAVSAVTQMELIVGCRNKKEMKILDDFLKKFEIINITEEITRKAVELLKVYRLSHGLLIADSLIASTALILEASLITKNQKDYKFIDELDLKIYP
jgi:predicted nucleic acid-binding protein